MLDRLNAKEILHLSQMSKHYYRIIYEYIKLYFDKKICPKIDFMSDIFRHYVCHHCGTIIYHNNKYTLCDKCTNLYAYCSDCDTYRSKMELYRESMHIYDCRVRYVCKNSKCKFTCINCDNVYHLSMSVNKICKYKNIFMCNSCFNDKTIYTIGKAISYWSY